MAQIFVSDPGVAVVFDERPGVPALLRLDGNAGMETQSAVITDVSFSRTVNHQVRHTFEGVVCVHPFGEKVGDVVLSGVVFRGRCSGEEESDLDHGINQVNDYFTQNSLANRSRPIAVTVGRQAVLGFLVAMRGGLREDEFALGRFEMVLLTMPPLTNRRV